MREYSKLLMLAYFEQYKEGYILFDLVKILGITYQQLEVYIQELKNESLIEYKDGMLCLTKNGLSFLINKEMYKYSYSDEDYLEFKIDTSKSWDLSRPYIPKNFMSKI